ncbi:helix-turn-helix domain-containing protein [Thauera humireducens]|uniref:helix-turn-helix domain-containing protein n=1 Tax=Thauera humireducens TaxID=1134435 RepID=UPI00387F5404
MRGTAEDAGNRGGTSPASTNRTAKRVWCRSGGTGLAWDGKGSAERPTDGGAIHPWGWYAHRRRHHDSNTGRGVRASNAAQADRARGLRAQGMSIRAIAAELGVSKSTVADWIR